MDIKNLITDTIEKINPKSNKIALFGIVIVVLIILLIIAINVLISTISGASAGAGASVGARNPVVVETREGAPPFVPTSNDLKIPPEYMRSPGFTWRPFRVTPRQWSKNEIERFLKDPADVIIEVYSEEIERHIQNMLRGIP
ncbi:MAG: hypothetical protein FWC36_01530 [Spirochaetes bacterium]|nr:hypothetical protein [Spirochaetota bacterium]